MDRQVRILFVDDECGVLQALKRVFLGCDYHILTACSGEEGLDLLRTKSQVPLVVSDYRMPGMNGAEFLVKVLERWPETITMVLSGYADTAAVVAAVNEGQIYRFISKPWNDDALRMTVANALEFFAVRGRNAALVEDLRLKNFALSELNARLEQLVADRSSDLLLQRRALLHAENVLEHLPIGVIALDPDGVVRQINLVAVSLLRVESNLVVGKRLGEGVPSLTCVYALVTTGEVRLDQVIKLHGSKLRIRSGPAVEKGEVWTVLIMETVDRG